MKLISKKQKAFTLIELVIFIVVIGIVAAGVLLTFNQVLTTTVTPQQQDLSVQLAKERMELILGQRWAAGFASFVDPCASGPPPSVCTLPSGYSIAQPTVATDVNPNFKTITVSVTGPSNATVTARVANY